MGSFGLECRVSLLINPIIRVFNITGRYSFTISSINSQKIILVDVKESPNSKIEDNNYPNY